MDKKNIWSLKPAFTLMELLVVIGIIGILAIITLISVNRVRSASYLSRAKSELQTIATALQMYDLDHNGYPADKDRDLPPGLEVYLGPGTWPKAPWPESVYDWENWTVGGQKIYQISVRFCPEASSPPQDCHFPSDSWASGFDGWSAVYYCISGLCRSHQTKPINHPGYCVNCP